MRNPLFLMVLFVSCSSLVHRCSHEYSLERREMAMAENPHPRWNWKKTSSSRRAIAPPTEEGGWNHIRILFDTSNLDSDGGLSAAQRSYLKGKILPIAEGYVNGLLKVKRFSSNLTIDRTTGGQIGCDAGNKYVAGANVGKCFDPNVISTCSGGNSVIVPEELLDPLERCATQDANCSWVGGGMVGYDTVLFVISKNIENCIASAETLAYAIDCPTAPTLGNSRPYVGMINFCPGRYDPTENDDVAIDTYARVAVHEAFHALGFSDSFFKPGYDTYKITSGRSTATSELFDERDLGATVLKIVAPKSLEKARQHFSCTTLNGLEMENVERSGTKWSHTESRIFYGDVMNGVITHNPVFSPISLAVLEDSGWYKGDFNNTEKLWWLNEAGCSAATSKCLTGSKSAPTITGPEHYHFCTVNSDNKCTADTKAWGQCIISSDHVDIPAGMQYFTEATKGGYDEVADYCPYYMAATVDAETGRTTNCRLQTNNYDLQEYYGERYGPTAACFESTLTNGIPSDSTLLYQGRCYTYSCLWNDEGMENQTIRGVKISINNEFAEDRSVDCFAGHEGEATSVGGTWWGKIKCPRDFRVYCGGQFAYSQFAVGPDVIIDYDFWDFIIDNYWILIVAGCVAAVFICLVILAIFSCCCSCSGKKRKSRSRRMKTYR